jgi:ABC-type oligopeptide transport system ATPase subunit
MSEEIKGKPILEVEHLKMYFPLSKGFMKKADGVVKAVDDISFSVERG